MSDLKYWMEPKKGTFGPLPRRIAILGTHYSPPFFRGGEERVIYYLNEGLTKRGITVHIYTPRFAKWHDIDKASTATNATRLPVVDVRFYYNLQFARRVRCHLEREHYDAILNSHILLGYRVQPSRQVAIVATTCLGEAKAIQGKGVKKVIERLVRRVVAYPFERHVLHHCAHVICVNRHISDEVNQWYRVPSERISVIGNGVPDDHYRAIENKHEANAISRILYVGRLVDRKNVDSVIRAASRLKADGIRFQVRLVGEGEERGTLQALAHELGHDDCVVFCGRQSASEVLKEYQQADVFVLPSRYEGMPLVLLEALACGLPCVVSDFEGVREIIYDGYNGRVVDGNSTEDIARVLSGVLQNPDARSKMSENARQMMVNRFSWERIIDQYIEILARVAIGAA